jgi:hypothetical protein
MTAFPSIAEALEELVPPFDAIGDWEEIVSRAVEPKVLRPRLVAGVVVVAVVLALLATPAFGVQGLVLHLLGRKDVSFHTSPAAPNLVKKRFYDLSRTPIGFMPGAIARQARDAGTVLVHGHRRHLYVVPTREGGYCWEIQQDIGSCRTRAKRAYGFGVGYESKNDDGVVLQLSGDVSMPAAASITVHYADGSTADVPFVWVSAPIDAGFFSYDIPGGRRLTSVTVEARDGRQLGIQPFTRRRRAFPPSRVMRRPPPLRTTAPPTAPLQESTANGFRVVVGSNGVAELIRVGTTPAIRRIAGSQVQYECFRLTTEFGIFTVREFGAGGPFASSRRFVLRGVGRPVDGCEIQAGTGHLWPDWNGSHTPVEVPLTARGRAFFANRAAARDLTLFIRTKHVQQLDESPAQAIRKLEHLYGKALAHSAIRLSAENGDLVLRERSTTGRLFTVAVHDGRVVRENVRPFSVVF